MGTARTRGSGERDHALVLRRYPYGESSLVVHVTTPRHGRVHLLAKGAFRPKSRLCGVLDLFDTLELVWRPSPRSEVAVLAEADIATRRRPLSADLERYRTGLSILELLDLASAPGRADPELFRLTETWLDLVAAGEVEPELALVAFDLRFLQNLGLTPALERCASCGSAPPRGPAPREVAFSRGAGGRLCANCAREARASGRRVGTLPVNVLRIASSLVDAPPATLGRFRPDPAVRREVRALVERFLEYHLETRPRTRRAAPGRTPSATAEVAR